MTIPHLGNRAYQSGFLGVNHLTYWVATSPLVDVLVDGRLGEDDRYMVMTMTEMTVDWNDKRHVVELDSRRRTSLGKVGRHDRYLVSEEPDGTLIFEPAVVMSELEARLMSNKTLVAEMEE